MRKVATRYVVGADGAKSRVPLKRFAAPEEVAKAVLFLVADATYATGSALRLDGGTTII